MTQAPHNFDPEIMRAYDIRGKYNINLSDTDSYYLGLAMGTLINQEGLDQTVCVGRDGRLSSPALYEALCKGLTETGMKITDIGVVATPTLYYATMTKKTTAGIMITGSHNPGDQNGYKLVYQGLSFYGDRIQLLSQIAKKGQFSQGAGSITTIDIKDEYVRYLSQHAAKTLGRKLKVAWDPGNGATGELVEMLCKLIDADHVLINTTIDGTFPNHHPDPTLPENMAELIALVKKHGCDFGLAFDGDGDRLGAVDENGRMVFGDQLLLILAKDLLSRKPGAKVIADVKTSDLILEKIREFGGEPIVWKTGHSLIKAKMKQEGAMLAGEMSGHLFFGEEYFGFDDALFAACKIINIMSNADASMGEMIDSLPVMYSTPELRVEVQEEIKFKIVDDLKSRLISAGAPFNDLDGVRVKADNGWWLVRASNTQNSLIVRVEGHSKQDLQSLGRTVIAHFESLGVDSSEIAKCI